MSYSPEMIAELSAIEGLDWEKAQAFAKAHMIKPRSVISKAAALGLPYIKAGATAPKKGEPRASKASLVAAVEARLALRAPSLDKVSLADLTAILHAL